MLCVMPWDAVDVSYVRQVLVYVSAISV